MITISQMGNWDGLPRGEFPINLPKLKGVKKIEVFGSYGNELFISEKYVERVRKNLVDTEVIPLGGEEKDTIWVAFPRSFRMQYLRGNPDNLKKALRCLFK